MPPASEAVLLDRNLLGLIFCQLPAPSDLCRSACCCHAWREASKECAAWKKFVAARFPEAASLVGVNNHRALYARLLRADPDAHKRKQSTLQDYQFVVRVSYDGKSVFASSFRYEEGGPFLRKMWKSGAETWHETADMDMEDVRPLQWLVDVDTDWLAEDLAVRKSFRDPDDSPLGRFEDPRLGFLGDGLADARSLCEMIELYTDELYNDGCNYRFDALKPHMQVSVFRASDQRIATLVDTEVELLHECNGSLNFKGKALPVGGSSAGCNHRGDHRPKKPSLPPSKDIFAVEAKLSPIRDPGDHSRARWILQMETTCQMLPECYEDAQSSESEGESESESESEGEDSAELNEDTLSTTFVLTRDELVRKLECLRWV